MENLKQLVAIKSDKNGDEIIQYLNMRFTQLAQEIKIIKNKENNNKSILIGLNTPLDCVWPHCACRAH
jgi:hypothetical protein